MSLIKLDGETILGLNEQLEKLKASDGYLLKKSAMKTKAAHPSGLKGAERVQLWNSQSRSKKSLEGEILRGFFCVYGYI